MYDNAQYSLSQFSTNCHDILQALLSIDYTENFIQEYYIVRKVFNM